MKINPVSQLIKIPAVTITNPSDPGLLKQFYLSSLKTLLSQLNENPIVSASLKTLLSQFIKNSVLTAHLKPIYHSSFKTHISQLI